MDTNAVTDIAIGLILMYLLLSLVCTVINEFIGTLSGLRAATLRQGIERIVDDPDTRAALQATGVMKMSGLASGGKGPSYIPSRTFALGILEVLHPERKVADAAAMKNVLGAIDNLPDSAIKSTLAALARDTGEDLESFRTSVAVWFDDMMDRAGGVFRRKMQLCSFIVAVLLVVAVNGDSVQVAKTLWQDATLRAQIANAAVELVEDTGLVDDLVDIKMIAAELRPIPIGWDFESPGWSGDWYRSPEGWLLKFFGLLFTAAAVSLGAPFWFDLLKKFVNLRGAGKAPDKQKPAAAGAG